MDGHLNLVVGFLEQLRPDAIIEDLVELPPPRDVDGQLVVTGAVTPPTDRACLGADAAVKPAVFQCDDRDALFGTDLGDAYCLVKLRTQVDLLFQEQIVDASGKATVEPLLPLSDQTGQLPGVLFGITQDLIRHPCESLSVERPVCRLCVGHVNSLGILG